MITCESFYIELKCFYIFYKHILNSSLPSVKESGFADANMALKDKETNKTKKEAGREKQESPSNHSVKSLLHLLNR